MNFKLRAFKPIIFTVIILVLSNFVLAMSNKKATHKLGNSVQQAEDSVAIRTAWLDKDKGDNILKAAQGLNFNSVIVYWNKETTPDFIKRAKSFGLDTYVWVFPTFPQGDKDKYSQVMSEQEEAICKKEIKLAHENKLFTSGYQGGGEPLSGDQEVLIYDVPCFHHREVVEEVKRRVKEILESAPGLAGISLDMFGYKNYHCCYCDTSKQLFEQYYKDHRDMDRDSAWEKFNLETLVDYQNEICNYARSIRPDVKITNHIWPTYLANPTYGNMLDVDYCAQTAAWFFKPYWSDEKISKYTKLFVGQAKKYYKRPQGVPFVGYYNREGYTVKSPERLAHEVDVILSNSGNGNLAIHCFGDLVKTPAAFNALKEVLIKHGIVDKVAAKKSVLAPIGDEKTSIELFNGNTAAIKILLPNNPTSLDIKASNMLADALEKGTGVRFNIVREDDYSGGAVFSIGQTRLYRESSLKPSIDLKGEGYMIAEKDGSIFLVGGKRRGAISPVIALIEEDFGGRLYSRQDGLQMPKISAQETITIREYTPAIELRSMWQFESFDRDFQLFNRVGASRSDLDRVPDEWGGNIKLSNEYFVHTLGKLLPNEKYFRDHPEYYSLRNGIRLPQGQGGGGNICMTNPDVRRIVADKVLDELKTLHKYGLFDVSAMDTEGYCECQDCQKLANLHGSSGLLIDFVNSVARKVKKDYPDVKISTLAYNDSEQPPKNIAPDDNVIIRLSAAAMHSDYYPMFTVDESDKFINSMNGWRKLGAKFYVWDFTVDFKGWPLPRPNLEVIGRNIEIYSQNNVFGLFLQGSHYGVGENQAKLRSWVYAKKMWDPSRDTKELIREFNYGYFGKVADLMQDYSDLLSREWHIFHDNHNFKDSLKYPKRFTMTDEFYPQAREIFEKALAQSKDDPALHSKVELEFLSILFYRLENIPPNGEEGRKSYIKDLHTFEDLAAKHNLNWITEGTTRTPQRIVEWKRKYNIRFANDKPSVVYLATNAITRIGDGAKVINEESSPNGLCVKIPIYGNAWAVQWFFGSALFNDVDYLVKIKVRADKNKQIGSAFDCGIYSVINKTSPLVLSVDSKDLSGNDYEWFDCGNVNGSDVPSAYFFFAQIPNSSIDYLYVSGIEFIPEGDPEYKANVRDKPIEHSLTPADIAVGEVVSLTSKNSQVLPPTKKIWDAGHEIISISPTSKAWHAKWHIFDSLAIGEYKVRALLKLKGQKEGYGIRFGVYSPKAKKEIFSKVIQANKIPQSDAYQWVELGTANITDDAGAYFFATSGGDNSFESFFLSKVEFVRVK